jgi:NAD/NADP transhydrogenase beta subunit
VINDGVRNSTFSNELFYNPNTEMLFGDAKKSIESLIASVKGL